MVEQPYYEAEMESGGIIYEHDLVDTINEYGIRKKERRVAKFGTDNDSYTEVIVSKWHNGPLLYLTAYNDGGNVERPTLGNSLCRVILREGYVPWGFRREMIPQVNGGREHTGRWLWYLRPVEDITDEESDLYETMFAIKTPDGEYEYLRNDDDALVTFDNRADAEAVADNVEDGTVIEV